MRKRPSIKAIVVNDYAAFLATMFPLVFFGMALVIRVVGFMPDLKRGRNPLGPENIPFYLILGAVTLLIGAVVIILRYRRINDYFLNGVEITGVVVKRSQFRDRGRIYFQYISGDTEYTASAAVHFSGRVKRMKEGQEVAVLIKRNDPPHSILKDLYVGK